MARIVKQDTVPQNDEKSKLDEQKKKDRAAIRAKLLAPLPDKVN